VASRHPAAPVATIRPTLAPTGRRKKTHEIQKASQALRVTVMVIAHAVPSNKKRRPELGGVSFRNV
jgi:hypothetical protein